MFKKSIGYNILILSCLIILPYLNIAKAEQGEITELYIEGEGNNRYESQIKAHTLGMRRAFYLIADKMKIDKEHLSDPSYESLKKTFLVKSNKNEKITDTNYSTIVSYDYDKGKFLNLLHQYGDESVDDKFQEMLVIPVFKKKQVLNLWDNPRWNNLWNDSRIFMAENKIFLPVETLYLSKNIRSDNLFNLKFNDYVDIFKNDFFKSIMIVSAEFFTDRKTGGSNIRIVRHILSPHDENPRLETSSYAVNNPDDVSNTVDIEINKIINEYGKIRSDVETSSEDLDKILTFDETNLPIVMNFSVYQEDEVEIIRKKLESVNEIENFAIKFDSDNKYNIIIQTDKSEYELAEGLYHAGLSYRIYGNLYHLIDIKNGG